MAKKTLPVRRFRCRLDELGPLNDMVQAMFVTNQADFGAVSPDYLAADHLKTWKAQRKTFGELVPTGVRRASDKAVTKAMSQLATGLRDPLNWLNIRLNRAEKKGALADAVAEFGLSRVRVAISGHDMESLDGALNHLLQLVQAPANLAGLTAQGHTAADTQALKDARQQLTDFNVTQNENQNAALELTEENVLAGNALWDHLMDVLETGNLLYKETQPKKAKTFTMATLMRRVRREHGSKGGDGGAAEG